MEAQIYSVSEINSYIKSVMDRDGLLTGLCLRGELSNYKIHSAGHHYFTLKDDGGAIRCVLFRSSSMRLRFRPENGMKVLATGRITVFPRDGSYQMYCEFLMPEGAGDLHVAFEQLKQRLQAEGLFDPAHKKPIPKFPGRIAVITSATGAAIQDLLRILGKRYPLAKVIVLPVRVQGAEAAPEIRGAIRYVNRFRLADVIITGRGGGSMEDLWCFNDERVARAIYESDIPVISAVGHEPDVTIADYVADLRAATPSNGAELAVPDQTELRQQLQSLQIRLQQATMRKLKSLRQELDSLKNNRVLQNPVNYLQDRRLLVDYEQKRLQAAMDRILAEKKHGLVQLASGLDAMSPLKVLARGYSVTRDASGQIVSEAAALRTGERITVTLRVGEIEAAVTAVQGEEHNEKL